MVTEVMSDSVSVAAITHFRIVDDVKQQNLLDIEKLIVQNLARLCSFQNLDWS